MKHLRTLAVAAVIVLHCWFRPASRIARKASSAEIHVLRKRMVATGGNRRGCQNL